MSPKKKSTVDVQGSAITVIRQNNQDYVSITDIARHKDPERTDYLISNWMRNRNTIEFLGIWEQLNNPDFNPIEFDGIKKRIIPSALTQKEESQQTTCLESKL